MDSFAATRLAQDVVKLRIEDHHPVHPLLMDGPSSLLYVSPQPFKILLRNLGDSSLHGQTLDDAPNLADVIDILLRQALYNIPNSRNRGDQIFQLQFVKSLSDRSPACPELRCY